MPPLPGFVVYGPDVPTTSVVGYGISSLRDWRQRLVGSACERAFVDKHAGRAIFDLEDHRNIPYYFVLTTVCWQLCADNRAGRNCGLGRRPSYGAFSRIFMKRLIECVPNFSEGREAPKMDAIVEAMRSVPGVSILDRSSDADHNRSVVTLAGEPEAVAEAAICGVGKAAELIDLTRHSGVHPRIGATDVLPFIPVEGCTIEDCVDLAHRVGREIWGRYRIPVYFYEAAAMKPERVNLEDVRRGQFEGLREEAFRNPDRSPDIGEPRLHPTAGAVAVGARKFLIAYNIHLDTPDVTIAKKIAKAIRFSSGGLRYVKAMGVELKSRGLAQVSMNLTDFERTPLHRVFEMVKSEAERYGCAVVGSEIVGLIPRKAIELTAEFYLKLDNFSPGLVLENRLAAALESPAVQKPIDAVSAPPKQ